MYSAEPTILLARRHLKDNALDQFRKWKFHFEHFPGNTRFLSFGGPINYLYLFKNHRQIFSWLRERQSSHLKVTKVWFGRNIKYLSEPFFADFCCREGISCWKIRQKAVITKLLESVTEMYYKVQASYKNTDHWQITDHRQPTTHPLTGI